MQKKHPEEEEVASEVDGERPLITCMHCHKPMATKSRLAVHMRMHTGEQPHTCHQCDRSFTQKSYLTAHLRTHMGGKRWECPLCAKQFMRQTYMYAHIRKAHGDM